MRVMFLAFLLLVQAVGWGEDLQLGACFRIAMDTNPSKKAAEENVESRYEDYLTAFSPYYPQISFHADYTRLRERIFLPNFNLSLLNTTFPNIVGPVNECAMNVQGSWILFDSGLTEARLLKARSQKNLAFHQKDTLDNEILLNVSNAFFDYMKALADHQAALSQLARAEDHYRIASKRARAGDVPPVDLFRTKSEVEQSRLSVFQSKKMIKLQQGALNVSMGLPPYFPLASTLKAPFDPPAYRSIDLCTSIEQAYENRSEILEAFDKMAIAKQSINEVKSQYGPSVVARGLYGGLDTSFVPQEAQWVVGVSLDWPLFEGFRTTHQLRSARHGLNQAVFSKEEVTLKVYREVWEALASFEEQEQALVSTVEAKNYASEAYRLTKRRYEVGSSPLNDLLDAESTLYTAERQAANARAGHYRAYATFLWSVGVLGCF